MNDSEFDDEQHLTDVQLQKLRSVVKTELSGELTISENRNFFSSDYVISIGL